MTVEPLQPDIAPPSATGSGAGNPSAFTKALDAFGSLLDGAGAAEEAYANGSGSLQAAVYERARADVALSVAVAAAQRAAAAITSLTNMQI
jgi:flagellar hook-basal body complex protein FliE